MLKRLLFFITLICLFIAIQVKANSIILPGSYGQTADDILTLNMVEPDRTITYNVGILAGNQIDFMVRYSNLSALNTAFGDTVQTGSFSLFAGNEQLVTINDITSGFFNEITADVGGFVNNGQLQLTLQLLGDSDPLIFYQPWLRITDSIPPSATSDFEVTQSYSEALRLEWTATGDDGMMGPASLYEIRYSKWPVGSDTLTWWNYAEQASNLPDPSDPGNPQIAVISELDTVSIYYFILITYDEVGNASAFSNVAEGLTGDENGGDPVSNYCLYYDGNQLTDFPFYSAFNTGNNLTVEVWFNLSSDYDWMHTAIIDKPAPTHANPFYQYTIRAANHSDLYAHIAIDGDYDPIEIYDVIQNNTWTHAAITYNGQYKDVYVNGLRIAHVNDPGQINNYSTGIRLGSLKNLFYGFFKGKIDDVRIWNIARSQEQIQNFMNQPLTGSEPGLVAYWNFDEGEGQQIHDLTINSCNGFLGSTENIDQYDPMWVESDAPLEYFRVISDDNSENRLPTTVAPVQNYPNPFNAQTKITFNIIKSSHVKIEIFDMLGRRAKSLVDGHYQAGIHDLIWDSRSDNGESLTSGVYFCRLIAGDVEYTHKMLLLR